MSQKRIQDFGSPVVASSLKSLNQAFVTSAILNGNEFVVDGTDRLRINPGSAVTDEGVIIIEDEAKFLTITNTSVPVDYTVFYFHDDQDISGGVPAVLTLDTGLLTEADVSGVILGYVRYSGGAVPLATEHFIQPPLLKIGDFKPTVDNSDWLVPIRNQGYLVTTTTGSTIDITDTFDISGTSPEMFVKFRNNTGSTGGVILTFPFKVKERPYAILQTIIATDINVLMTASFVDTAGTVFALNTIPFTNETTLTLKTEDIPRQAVQTSNTIVYIQIDVSVAASREFLLQSIGLNQFNLPV
jgi:hypothetical protein